MTIKFGQSGTGRTGNDTKRKVLTIVSLYLIQRRQLFVGDAKAISARRHELCLRLWTISPHGTSIDLHRHCLPAAVIDDAPFFH